MKKHLLIVLTFLLIYSLIYWLFGGHSSPNIELEEDFHLYDNIYTLKEYDFSFLRVKENNSDKVRYFLEVGKDYYVLVNLEKYHDTKEEVFFQTVPRNTFLDIEIYSLNDELLNTLQFYFATDYRNLDYIDWEKWGGDYSFLVIPCLIIFIYLLNIAFQGYYKKKKTVNWSGEINLWKRFKNASLLSKIGYLLLFVIYLALPFPFVFIFIITLFIFLLIFGKGIRGRIVAISSYTLAVIIGLISFFGLYVVFVPEATMEHATASPETTFSTEARKAYFELVDDAMFYTLEPVVYYEENFGFIMLRTYVEWTYSTGDDILVIYNFRFYNITASEKSRLKLLFIQDDRILYEIDYSDKDHRLEEFTPEKEGNLRIEIREAETNLLLYKSEDFPVLKDINDAFVYFGGQYVPNEGKVLLLFYLFFHIGVIFMGLMLYIFRKLIFLNLKHKSLFLKGAFYGNKERK